MREGQAVVLLCGPPPHFGGTFYCILYASECYLLRAFYLFIFYFYFLIHKPLFFKVITTLPLCFVWIEPFTQSKTDNCFQNPLTSFHSTFFLSSFVFSLWNNAKQIQGQELTAKWQTSLHSAHLVCMVHVGSDCILIISYCEQIKLSNDRSTMAHSGAGVLAFMHQPLGISLPPLLPNGTCALVVIWKGYFLKPWPSVER